MKRTHLHEIRIGLVVVRIVRRAARRDVRLAVAAVRLYRNGDVWVESTRFSEGDIPVLRLALDQAYLWILTHQD
jgi:hypothetical protein